MSEGLNVAEADAKKLVAIALLLESMDDVTLEGVPLLWEIEIYARKEKRNALHRQAKVENR